MAVVKVDPDCPHAVRRVRRLIADHMGAEAAIVFGEAMANVREHGGQIAITSEVGKGSTFTVELPMRRFDPMRDSSESMPTLS